MERLTVKAKDSDMIWFKDTENHRNLEPCEMSAHDSRVAITRLAGYEDAEEQGRMIISPCSKGDKIYEFCNEPQNTLLDDSIAPENIINTRDVWRFEYYDDLVFLYTSCPLPARPECNDSPFCIPADEIGVYAFLTLEDAVNRIKQIRKEK